MDEALEVRQDAPSTAPLGVHDQMNEIPTFDGVDDEISWLDHTNEDDHYPPDVPDIVMVQKSTQRDAVKYQNQAPDNDVLPSGGKNKEIGPVFQVERKAEVDPKQYAPPQDYRKSSPLVHHYSLLNRPLHIRKLIPVWKLFSSPLSDLWKGRFDRFNHIQSEVSSVLVNTNDTLVVSAPTGAGKTAVFEMAMAKHLSSDLALLRESFDWHQKQLPSCRKIVYISPSKALCEERYEDWSHRFSALKLGIRTAMITGDAEPGETFRDIANSHLIITTPEKWDSLTRRWNENFVLIGSVKLLLVDEIHLLGDASRGGCLESVLCRMKTVFRATQAGELSETQIKSSR